MLEKSSCVSFSDMRKRSALIKENTLHFTVGTPYDLMVCFYFEILLLIRFTHRQLCTTIGCSKIII